MSARVDVVRGGAVESVHRIHVVVCDAAGAVQARAGDPRFPTFYRSAAKPLQALPIVEDGVAAALGLSEQELALCCASHNSEERHVEVALGILARVGLDASALACGGHPPLREAEGARLLAAGTRPGPIHSNCSGKHAGMLALARHHGWPVEGYHRPEHPVQRRMRREIARWSGVPEGELVTGTDGCGVVCFRVPLERAAASIAAFVASGDEGPRRIVRAMVREPWMVAGTGRLCTALMETTSGRVVAKVGAEGVYVAGVPSEGLGIALKAEDGARRAAEVALVRTLDALGLLEGAEAEALARWRTPDVRDTRGEVVGRIEAAFDLERT